MSRIKGITSVDEAIIYYNGCSLLWVRVRVMVFNATFNNMSAISWWSVLLVEQNEVPGSS